jgi:hypothetical protein
MEDQTVPSMTLAPRVIDEKSEENLKKWLVYIKNVSPRILITSIFQSTFSEYRDKLMEQIHTYLAFGDSNNTAVINNLEENDIYFFLAINTALNGEKIKHSLYDICIFCSNDRAFFLRYEGFDCKDEGSIEDPGPRGEDDI